MGGRIICIQYIVKQSFSKDDCVLKDDKEKHACSLLHSVTTNIQTFTTAAICGADVSSIAG